MRPEKHVALERLQDAEGPGEVLGHLGIAGVIDQAHAGEERRAPVDDDVVGLLDLFDIHRPGRTAPGMAGRQMGRERHAAERDVIPVGDDLIRRGRLVIDQVLADRQEVAPAAVGEQFGVRSLITIRAPVSFSSKACPPA